MSTTPPYDPDEVLLSPLYNDEYQVCSSTGGQSDVDPSPNSNNSSPQQYFDELGNNLTQIEMIPFSSTTQLTEKLQIIAQPRAYYRERYCSETDPAKNRAQRFIRADDSTLNMHEYPTIQIPSKWRDSSRCLYIRVTLATVFANKVPIVCIHPYAIDTQEKDVLHDLPNNSLYYPVTGGDILSGQKSFRISRKKMVQHDLKSYGCLRILDFDQHDIQRVENIRDAKQIIETYQLWKSQLVFTVAEHVSNNTYPQPIPSTSVTSHVMFDQSSGRQREQAGHDELYSMMFEDDTVKCTPRKGDWCGGDDVIMVIPKLDKRKEFDIYFDYGLLGKLGGIRVSFIDTKTFIFQTPRCAISEVKQNYLVSIVVIQNDLILACVEFVYLAPIITTAKLCSYCQFDRMNNNQMSSKRPHWVLDPTETDSGELLAQQMSRLTTRETPHENNQQSNNDDQSSRFDKYLSQLQEAVVEFVRTNNPSRLFRRTRLLIAKCEDNSPPLDDAIRCGHIDLALKLIEQAINMPAPNGLLDRENNDGEIPLLVAAKYNQWVLVKTILEKRSDFLEKIDKNDNNLLHLLANVLEGEVDQAITSVLALIPDDIKTKLLQKKNKDNQTPIEIAQTKHNSHFMDLFEKIVIVLSMLNFRIPKNINFLFHFFL